jgi:hypothetical protein
MIQSFVTSVTSTGVNVVVTSICCKVNNVDVVVIRSIGNEEESITIWSCKGILVIVVRSDSLGFGII